MALIGKFLARSWHDRALFGEALLTLGWAKFLVSVVPFRKLAPRLGRVQGETSPTIAVAERNIAVQVSWAVQAVARYIPLGFVCLPQAIAAQQMLRRRGIPSTIYLGVAPDRSGAQAIQAHAWLRAGDKIVTGEHEAARHEKLASFAA